VRERQPDDHCVADDECRSDVGGDVAERRHHANGLLAIRLATRKAKSRSPLQTRISCGCSASISRNQRSVHSPYRSPRDERLDRFSQFARDDRSSLACAQQRARHSLATGSRGQLRELARCAVRSRSTGSAGALKAPARVVVVSPWRARNTGERAAHAPLLPGRSSGWRPGAYTLAACPMV